MRIYEKSSPPGPAIRPDGENKDGLLLVDKLELRYLTSKDSALLRDFCSILNKNSPDWNRGGKSNAILNTLKLSERGKYNRNDYHVLLTLKKERIIGGAVFQYFLLCECGRLEHLFVIPEHRGKKYSRKILVKVERTLRQDAETRGGRFIGIFGEVENPFPVSDISMDPWLRLTILGKLGFSKVNINDLWHSIKVRKKGTNRLMLLFRSESTKENTIEPSCLKRFVQDYLKWTVGRKVIPGNMVQLKTKKQGQGSKALAMESLSVYCGEDDEHFYFREPRNKYDPDIRKALKIYKESFTEREFAIPTDLFLELINRKSKGMLGYKYHFLILKKRGDRQVVGFTEFFTLNTAGFGGYVAIRKNQQGKGLFNRMIRRMERTMSEELRNGPSKIQGWFAEFEKPQKTTDPFATDRLKIMLRMGFLPLKLIYDQPVLPGYVSRDASIQDKLYLAFKPFGDYQKHEISRELFLRFVLDLLRDCFYIAHPKNHITFLSIKRQVFGVKKVRFERNPQI